MARGLRGRLNALQADAHRTMGTARAEMSEAVDLLRGFLEELEDGVRFSLVIGGREIPVEVKMVAKEPDETPA